MTYPDTVRENSTTVFYKSNGEIDYSLSIETGTGYLGKECLLQVKKQFNYDDEGNVRSVSVTKTPWTPPLTDDELSHLRAKARVWRERELN